MGTNSHVKVTRIRQPSLCRTLHLVVADNLAASARSTFVTRQHRKKSTEMSERKRETILRIYCLGQCPHLLKQRPLLSAATVTHFTSDTMTSYLHFKQNGRAPPLLAGGSEIRIVFRSAKKKSSCGKRSNYNP